MLFVTKQISKYIAIILQNSIYIYPSQPIFLIFESKKITNKHIRIISIAISFKNKGLLLFS